MSYTETLQAIAQENEPRKKVEQFMSFLNQTNPSEKSVKKVPVGKGQKASYVPIEMVEMMLDMIFGEWSIENGHWKREINEIVYSLDLVVESPITGKVIRRHGVGAAPIQQSRVHEPDHPKSDQNGYRSASLSEIDETKIQNSLQSVAPAAKAMAVTNAAKSLGKRFGRDLNRDMQPQFIGIYENAEKKEEEKRALEFIDNTNEAEKLINAFSDDYLSKYPEVDQKLQEKLAGL